jgi:hypothetical protein
MTFYIVSISIFLACVLGSLALQKFDRIPRIAYIVFVFSFPLFVLTLVIFLFSRVGSISIIWWKLPILWMVMGVSLFLQKMV